MNPGKQLKAIRRELLASPRKAGVLGVLLVAAVYFWGPLAWRMVAPAHGTGKMAAAATGVVAAEGAPAPMPPALASAEIAVDWNEVREWRTQDPLTLTATFDPNWPEPFPVADMPLAGNGDASGDHASSSLASAVEAGLVLETVVYSKSRRAAIISGEIYREGDEVVVEPASGPEIAFTLRRIERRSVELTDPHGRVHILAIPLPKLTDTDRIEGSLQSSSEHQNHDDP